MRFTTGAVFGNRYVLGDRIAIGGMGEVWRATDQVLGRTVAIKLLSPSLAGQPGFTQRFREEARNTAALSHGNIAALYDYGEDDGASWLVMELVEGRPLSQIIKEEAPLDPERVSSIMAQAANALQAAHDAGVIHRDVKPANILVRDDGTVKLTDFGIARAVDAAPITRTGEVMGTAQYISPEQAMGRHVGPASDVYALGAVAHEMLTGKRAFDEGSPVATAMAHIHNPAPALPPNVPEPLAGVVMACLAKDPSLRPASARDVALALSGRPTSTQATQRLDPAPRTERLGTARRPAAPQPPRPAPSSATSAMRFEDPAEKRRTNPLVWLLPLLLVIGLVAFFALRGLGGGGSTPTPSTTRTITSTAPSSSSPTTGEVVASDFLGSSYEAARSVLQQRGFTVRKAEAYNTTYPAGQVCTVSPTGSDIPQGTTITLTVSKGASPTPTTSSSSATPSSSSPAPSTSTPQTQEPTQEPVPNESTGGGSAGNNAPHVRPSSDTTTGPTSGAGSGSDSGSGAGSGGVAGSGGAAEAGTGSGSGGAAEAGVGSDDTSKGEAP